MNVEEARSLLPMYADGLLDSGTAHEIEGVLAAAPDLQAEYQKLKEENALIAEALAPLHPSHSARIKLSEAMREAAEHVANTIPARGWRIFRYIFTFVTLLFFLFLVNFVPLNGRPVRVSEVAPGMVAITSSIGLRLQSDLTARCTTAAPGPTR